MGEGLPAAVAAEDSVAGARGNARRVVGAVTYTAGVPAETDARPRLVVLDSHGILYRAFFAFANSDSPLMTSKGELTFAVHGYAETLIRVLDVLRPTHICAAWDAGGKTFRHEASEAYKATRRETPEELTARMNLSIEKLVRRAPEQYLWIHDRWKSARLKGLLPPEAT